MDLERQNGDYKTWPVDLRSQERGLLGARTNGLYLNSSRGVTVTQRGVIILSPQEKGKLCTGFQCEKSGLYI